MEYICYELGYVNKGKAIEVKLSGSANVCLLDSFNYNKYKNGESFNYYGGYVTTSPYRLTIPRSDKWYVTVDLGGYGGSVRCSCIVLDSPEESSIESLKWQIQTENPDCTVKVTSRWLEKHPEYGDPNIERTDFLVFDKKNGKLHKHFSIGEDTNWQLHEWHDWY